jgi:hypothetical protein
MGYIILAKSREKQGEMVALVDRTKCKEHWWTENISKAIVFTSKDAAQSQCSKLKFNNPKVWDYDKGKVRLGQVEVITRRSSISEALQRKNSEWYDDDWYERMNDD